MRKSPAASSCPMAWQTVTLDVVPLSDELVEGPETVILTLAAGSYDISGGEAVVTIEDSNHPPAIPHRTARGG